MNNKLIIMFYRTFKKDFNLYKLKEKFTYRTYMINYEFSEDELKIMYQKVGEKVKQFRKEKNITQMQLSLAIGHNSVGHVAKAELYKYDKHFNFEQLYKISKILDVDMCEFLK